jgi:hypothetical protein
MHTRSNRVVPSFEAMEDRLLLSASYTCGPNFITITGDPAAVSTVVIDDAAGSFTVTGATKVGTGTLPTLANAANVTIKYTAKNQADTLTYNATTAEAHPLKSLVYTGGTAIDTVSVTDGAIKDVTIKAGDGANHVTINGAAVDIIGKLNITGGKNADTITLGGTTGTQILGAINLNLGAAGTGLQNDVEIGAGTYGAVAGVTPVTRATKFNIVGGNDIDLVKFTGATTVNGVLSMKLSGGNDSVLMNNTTGTGASAFNSNVTLDTGKGDDIVTIATSSNAATATFAEELSILLGDGNDILTLSGGHAANNITVTGDLNVDFGKSAATVGDRLVVGTNGIATTVTLNGDDNIINYGSTGLKTTTNINASSIVLGTGSSTSIGVKKSSHADVNVALKNGIASAVQGFTGAIDGLYIGII